MRGDASRGARLHDRRSSRTADDDAWSSPSDRHRRVLVWPFSQTDRRRRPVLPKGRGLNAARFDSTGERIVYVDTKGVVVVHDLRSGNDVTARRRPRHRVRRPAQRRRQASSRVAARGRGAGLAPRPPEPARARAQGPPRRRELGRLQPTTAGSSPPGWIARRASGGRAGRPTVVLRGHDDEVTTPIFTDDGARVLSSSIDGTVRLWDAAERRRARRTAVRRRRALRRRAEPRRQDRHARRGRGHPCLRVRGLRQPRRGPRRSRARASRGRSPPRSGSGSRPPRLSPQRVAPPQHPGVSTSHSSPVARENVPPVSDAEKSAAP